MKIKPNNENDFENTIKSLRPDLNKSPVQQKLKREPQKIEPTSDPSLKTVALAMARDKVKLGQKEAADWFAVRQEQVSAWELAKNTPKKFRRETFLYYLGDKLQLREDYATFKNIWKTVMVDVWKWPDLSNEELAKFSNEATSIPTTTDPYIPKNRDKNLSFQPPQSRPARTSHFKGQSWQLDVLNASVLPARIVMISGLAGMGKTSLAAEFIHRLTNAGGLQSKFPDGSVFWSFDENKNVNQAVKELSRVLGEKPEKYVDPWEAAYNAFFKRRVLVFLDGVENLYQEDESKLIEVFSHSGLLLASRRRTSFAGSRLSIVEPELIDIHGAIEILSAWSNHKNLSQDIAQKICEMVGFLPLALRLAGSRMFKHQISEQEFYKQLVESPLEALHVENRPHQSVRVLFNEMLKPFSRTTKQIVAVMGLLGKTVFPEEALHEAIDVPVTKLQTAIGDLLDYQLIKKDRDTYQVTHPLIHEYIKEKLDSKELGVPSNNLANLVMYFINRADSLLNNKAENLRHDLLVPIGPHLEQLHQACLNQEIWLAARMIEERYDTFFNPYWTLSGCANFLEKASLNRQYLRDQIQKDFSYTSMNSNIENLPFLQGETEVQSMRSKFEKLGYAKAASLASEVLADTQIGLKQYETAIQTLEQNDFAVRVSGDKEGQAINSLRKSTAYLNLDRPDLAEFNWKVGADTASTLKKQSDLHFESPPQLSESDLNYLQDKWNSGISNEM